MIYLVLATGKLYIFWFSWKSKLYYSLSSITFHVLEFFALYFQNVSFTPRIKSFSFWKYPLISWLLECAFLCHLAFHNVFIFKLKCSGYSLMVKRVLGMSKVLYLISSNTHTYTHACRHTHTHRYIPTQRHACMQRGICHFCLVGWLVWTGFLCITKLAALHLLDQRRAPPSWHLSFWPQLSRPSFFFSGVFVCWTLIAFRQNQSLKALLYFFN